MRIAIVGPRGNLGQQVVPRLTRARAASPCTPQAYAARRKAANNSFAVLPLAAFLGGDRRVRDRSVSSTPLELLLRRRIE